MWTVTRQNQWPDGNNVVEVSEGGLDYTNPDALSKRYDGEFEEFSNPIAAAEAAITICKAWREDYKGKRPQVGSGATGGYTMPFDTDTFKGLRAWAKETWAKLPKCACGDPLPEKRKRWMADDWSGDEFCSERCAEKEIEFQQEQNRIALSLDEFDRDQDEEEDNAE